MKRALITGATGFIGGRVAEVLCAQGTPAVALVRTWANAARLSRLPIEMVGGDVLDLDAVRGAMKGCDVVYHLAVDWRGDRNRNRRSSRIGTRNVLQAAREAGVRRIVVLSSVAVFGRRLAVGRVSEEEPTPYTGDAYGDGKIEAERLARDAYRQHGVPVVILRPTIVYGPFSRSWTEDTVTRIRQGQMVLIDKGAGTCNSLYVDNLVDAMLLSAQHPGAVGEVFHVSDAHPVTWKEFVEGHARALGDEYLPLPEMTMDEVEAARAQIQRSAASTVKQTLAILRDPRMRTAVRAIPAVARFERAGRWVEGTLLPAPVRRRVREFARGVLSRDDQQTGVNGQPPRWLMRQGLVHAYAAQTVFSIGKAQRVLGYAPSVSFAEGMARTAAWIRWARL
jgi:nucleoside-diphosphate-sugar epimerase